MGGNGLSVHKNIYFHIIHALIDDGFIFTPEPKVAPINGVVAYLSMARYIRPLLMLVLGDQMAIFELVT